MYGFPGGRLRLGLVLPIQEALPHVDNATGIWRGTIAASAAADR